MPGGPAINLSLNQLRRIANRGGAIGGRSEAPHNMALGTRRSLAHGGGTAGFGANPSRAGMPALHGTGRSAVPNGTLGRSISLGRGLNSEGVGLGSFAQNVLAGWLSSLFSCRTCCDLAYRSELELKAIAV